MACCSFPLIYADGRFNASELKRFSEKMKLSERGLRYKIVSIIGPQSSGKSTLLNLLFGTNFNEMDVAAGRYQTTRGIWLAKATNIDPFTLIMDVEGSDSSENNGDVTFEKQSALFALAMSDVLLINLWCNDIGREQAGCRTLLKTVVQMMMRLFSPRKRTLYFVIRDKSPTPLDRLKQQLLDSIKEIYDSVLKPEAHREASLEDYFDADVIILPHYTFERQAFNEEVDRLRQLIERSTTSGGHAGDQQDKLPASEIPSSAHTIWETIKKDKDLNLPKHKIMVSTVRCEEILNEKFNDFKGSQDWRTMENNLRSGRVTQFGKKMTSAIYTCLSKYEKDASFYDESVRSAKRQILQDKLVQLVQPAYQSMLGHLHDGALYYFQKALANDLAEGKPITTAAKVHTDRAMSAFDEVCGEAAIEQANWDSSSVRDKLKTGINTHIALAHAQVASSQAAAAAEAAANAQAAVAAANARAAAAAAAAAQEGRVNHQTPVQIVQMVASLAGLGISIASICT